MRIATAITLDVAGGEVLQRWARGRSTPARLTVLLLAAFFLYLLGPMQETIQAAGQPDLTLTGLSVSTNATAIAPGTTLSVSNTVKNQGDAAAGSFLMTFHLSTNTTYGDGDDVVITNTRTVNSLAAGAKSTATSKLTIPLTTPVGTYHLCVMVDSGNTVSESDEANNTFCTTETGQVTEPDLVLTAVTPTTSTVSSTATLSVTNTVENQGALSAGSSLIAYDLSPTASYTDPGAVAITATQKVNSLAVGASSTATTKLSIPLDTPAGSYFVCAKTDSANAVLELDETNNTQCSSTQVTVPASDLLLTAVSTTTTAIAPGKTLSASSTAKNQGSFPAGSSLVAFHLSTNTTYGDGDDVVLTATRAVNSLAAAAISTAASTLTIPSSTPVGTYHLCAIADSDDAVSESNEANNTLCTSGTIQVTEPDLVLTAVTPTTSTVSSTATLSVTNTVENQGALSAGSFLIAYDLSPTANYTDPGAVAITTTRTVNSLAVGASSTATTKLSIPLDTPAGSYFVCAQTDSANAVLELDETNNTQCSSTQVTVPASDLLLTVVSTTTTAIAPGKTLSASSTAKNQGGFPAGSSLIAFHLSTNTTYGDGDDVVITATRAVNSLAAAASSTATSTLTIPSSTPVGTYHLCAIADSDDAVSESNEANNTLCTSGTIQVTEPDLVLTAVSTTATAIAPGKTLSVSNTAKNQGSVPAGSSTVAFHLSTNTTYGDGDDVVLTATRAVNSLATGASSTATTKLTLPLNMPAGSYFICAKTDSANAVVELDETNNTRCSPSPVTVSTSSTTTTTTSTTTTTISGGSTTTTTTSTTTTTFPAGSLDAGSGFGITGKTTTAIGFVDDTVNALAVQSDGKLVTVGYSNTGSIAHPIDVFAVVRYNTNGNLDTTFGAGGIVTTPLGTNNAVANALAIQSDGKLVAAGYYFDSTQNVFAMVRYNTNGSLDTTFGAGGIATTPIGTIDDKANAVAVQSDGKLVAAGYSNNGTQTVFAMVRYNPNGSLDTGFGTGGIVTTVIGNADFANALAVQSDGKLVAAGYSLIGALYKFALVRYNPDGSLDTGFGTAGIVTSSVGTSDSVANALAIQPDGKLVAAGYSFTGAANVFALARYNTNGSLDTTFSGDGKATTAIGTVDDEAKALAIQSDGKLVAAGYSFSNGFVGPNVFVLVRYKTNGSLDTTFGTGGKATTAVGGGDSAANAMAIQPLDGKLVAAGYSDKGTANGFSLVRYSTDGSLDTTFAGGITTTPIGTFDDETNALAVQSDGKLVVAGYSQNSLGQDIFALIRYNTDGSLDKSFSVDGIVTTAIGTIDDEANALAVQSDGKLVAAGYSNNGTQNRFALVRYNSNGIPDTTFGAGGKVTTAIGTIDDVANALFIQSDGKLVATGYSKNGTQNRFALVRYNTNGSLDTTFGTGGIVTTAIGTIDDAANALFIQPDGKLVAAGYSNNGTQNRFALVRYNTNGSLDTTFGTGGIMTTAIGTIDDAANALFIQSDGKLVAAGYSQNSLGQDVFALVRYNTNGSLDTTFGTGGIMTTSIGTIDDEINALSIQSDGKLVAAGDSFNGTLGQNVFALVRYNTNGSLDTAFGAGGKVTTAIGSDDFAKALAIQSDGKLVTVGYSFNATLSQNEFAVVRYNP